MYTTNLGRMLAMKWPNAKTGSASITFMCETAAKKTDPELKQHAKTCNRVIYVMFLDYSQWHWSCIS